MILALQQSTGTSLRQVCQAMGFARSSFYHAAAETATQASDRQMSVRIEAIFKAHRRRYGYRRVGQELRDQELVCAPGRVRRLMKQRGLKAIQPKNFVPKTSDGKANQPAPNLLKDQPLPKQPNRVWAGDITFIPTQSGWLYLAVVIDLCSRRIVGWSLAHHLRTELVLAALNQALASRTGIDQTIFHSDRGSQYGSIAFRRVLAGAGLRQSMSARANPYDNAWTESFIGTLKAEMLQGGCFETSQDAQTELFEYIEAYYNNQRKHSALGYQTPNQFELQLSTLN
jgi:transposase InsO family protein